MTSGTGAQGKKAEILPSGNTAGSKLRPVAGMVKVACDAP